MTPVSRREELAKATRSEVVQVIGTKFVLYRESHCKPKEKRIAAGEAGQASGKPQRSNRRCEQRDRNVS